MRISRIVIAVAAALILQLSGCTTLINIETVRPPVVQVSHDQWKVLVINRYDPVQTAAKNERVAEVFREGAHQAVGGAMGAIYNDSTFMLVNPSHAIVLPSSASGLSSEEIQELYTSYSSHLILTLDKFDANFDKTVESYEDEDGSRSKTAHYDLRVITHWTLYDSTGTVLDQATLRQQTPYDSRAVISGLLAIGPAMGKAGPVLNELAVESGYSYWDRMYPLPILLVRQVYSQQQFIPALSMLQSQQVNHALQSLLPIAQNSSHKHSAKAAYNLAVAYEAAGNYEQAIYWAKEAHAKGEKLAIRLLQLWSSDGVLKFAMP